MLLIKIELWIIHLDDPYTTIDPNGPDYIKLANKLPYSIKCPVTTIIAAILY